MAEFDDKLNSILSNPEVMSQIMSMANAMNQDQSPPPQRPKQPEQSSFDFNPAAMQSMMQMLKTTQIDQKQRNLIRALECYLPRDRLERLEKAMQAAKIARFASSALGKKSDPGR